jgi:spore germination cell wall hydrolase CwlJ-like protein
MRRALIFIGVMLTTVYAAPNDINAKTNQKPNWDLSVANQKPDWDLSKVKQRIVRTPPKIDNRAITALIGSEYRSKHRPHHAGIDIQIPAGSPVRAARAGTIIRAGTLGGYGYVIDIDHGDGYTTRYGHLRQFLRKKGTVEQGEIIARSGGEPGEPGAGRSTGAHLHFEIRVRGKTVNPELYPSKIEAILTAPQSNKTASLVTNREKPEWKLSSAVQTKHSKYNKHVNCLAQNIYHEARGESIKGQIAVAQVVLNRTKNDSYSSDICEVVWDRYQFSWTLERSLWRITDKKSYDRAMYVARSVLAGKYEDPTGGATHYYEPTQVNPEWAQQGVSKKRIGSHLFMRMKSGGA